MILRRDLILTEWRWLNVPDVGVFAPYGAVSTRVTAVFIRGFLELSLYGRISNS